MSIHSTWLLFPRMTLPQPGWTPGLHLRYLHLVLARGPEIRTRAESGTTKVEPGIVGTILLIGDSREDRFRRGRG